MRIKQDFITNSSSMAYVVFVPSGINMGQFISIQERVQPITGRFGAEVSHELVLQIMQEIQGSTHFYRDDDYIVTPEVEREWEKYCDAYDHAIDVLDQAGFMVYYDEGGPENCPCVTNLGANKEFVKKISKTLEKINVTT